MQQSNFKIKSPIITPQYTISKHHPIYRFHYQESSNKEHLILVIGQQPSLAQKLQISGYQLMYISSGLVDIKLLFSLHPSLAIVDWTTEQSCGVDLCHEISATKPDLPIVLLTDQDCVYQRITGLNAGALSCVAKPYRWEEVLARVRVHIKHRPHSHEPVFRCGNVVLNSKTRQVYCSDREVQLTAKEFNLLKCLMSHKQQVMTRDQIIRNVWGYDFIGESNLIEVYISCLRRKLKRASAQPLIHTVRNIGYVMREETSHANNQVHPSH
ncbi:MAG: response regulator transcription factor [Synechococcus sp.]